MSEIRVSVVPVGKVDRSEIEGAAQRVSKVVRTPVSLEEAVPVPVGTEDPGRRQHRADRFLALARKKVARPAPAGTLRVFVTDVDLFLPAVDAVPGHPDPAHAAALVSVRRLREAFYRRKSDPKRQRARLVNEILRHVGHLKGMPACQDPSCAMSSIRAVADLDRKAGRYCAPCWKRLSTGTMRI